VTYLPRGGRGGSAKLWPSCTAAGRKKKKDDWPLRQGKGEVPFLLEGGGLHRIEGRSNIPFCIKREKEDRLREEGGGGKPPGNSLL